MTPVRISGETYLVSQMRVIGTSDTHLRYRGELKDARISTF